MQEKMIEGYVYLNERYPFLTSEPDSEKSNSIKEFYRVGAKIMNGVFKQFYRDYKKLVEDYRRKDVNFGSNENGLIIHFAIEEQDVRPLVDNLFEIRKPSPSQNKNRAVYILGYIPEEIVVNLAEE